MLFFFPSLGHLFGFPCDICKKCFTSRITLTKHRIWHHKEKFNFKYNCDCCPYGSDHLQSFKKHSIVHSNNRNFKCRVCGNRFASQASLNQHLIIHTGEVGLLSLGTFIPS